jgi:hypothetical protein
MSTRSTIPTVARSQRPQEASCPRREWPTFLVTAAHSVPAGPGRLHDRMPYGPWHARQVGSLQTACGMSAVTWQYFWTLDFHRAGGHACEACARAIGARG